MRRFTRDDESFPRIRSHAVIRREGDGVLGTNLLAYAAEYAALEVDTHGIALYGSRRTGLHAHHATFRAHSVTDERERPVTLGNSRDAWIGDDGRAQQQASHTLTAARRTAVRVVCRP